MIEICSLDKFKQAIAEHEICLVKFGTTWCGPCRVMQKTLQNVEKDYDNVYFIEVDAESAEEIAAEYDVTTVPEIFVIKNGEVVSKTLGLQTKEQIEKRLNID